MLKSTMSEDFEEIECLTEDEAADMEAICTYNNSIEKSTYIESMTNTLAWATKNAFVYGAKYLGASFIAVTVVPKAVPHIARYFAPSLGGMPGVAAATATVAFASGTVGLTGELSRQMAEGAWNSSSGFLGYMFNNSQQNTKDALEKTNLVRKKNKNKTRNIL